MRALALELHVGAGRGRRPGRLVLRRCRFARDRSGLYASGTTRVSHTAGEAPRAGITFSRRGDTPVGSPAWRSPERRRSAPATPRFDSRSSCGMRDIRSAFARRERGWSRSDLPVRSQRDLPVKTNLLNLEPSAAVCRRSRDFAVAHGEPGYRGGQVVRRLVAHARRGVRGDDRVCPSCVFAPRSTKPFDIPRHSRSRLGRSPPTAPRSFCSACTTASTSKRYLIPEGDRLTFCVSSQAGCALRCAFCATGLMGFARNLETYEIVGQAFVSSPCSIRRSLPANIVFMGMGEPAPVVCRRSTDLTILNDAQGFGIGARHITVSTVGCCLVSRRCGAAEQFRLAISIHAPVTVAAHAHADQHEVSAGRRDRGGR